MDDINTEQNMKSICWPAVAQWTQRLTRKGQTRVRNWKGANILLSHFAHFAHSVLFSAIADIVPFQYAQVRHLLIVMNFSYSTFPTLERLENH